MTAALALIGGMVLAVGVWLAAARSAADATRMSLVAVLGVSAAAFNVIVPIASVEATTTTVLCTAAALGARTGLGVGAVAVLGSSIAGGLGPWTPWQLVGVAAVAAVGAATGAAARRAAGPGGSDARLALAAAAAVATLAYDVVVTVPTLLVLAPGEGPVAGQAGAALLVGAPFTLVHVLATTAMTWAAAPALLHCLARARLRFDVDIRAAG